MMSRGGSWLARGRGVHVIRKVGNHVIAGLPALRLDAQTIRFLSWRTWRALIGRAAVSLNSIPNAGDPQRLMV